MKSLARPLHLRQGFGGQVRGLASPAYRQAGVFRGNYCSSPDDKIIGDPRQSRDRFACPPKPWRRREFSKAKSGLFLKKIKKFVIIILQ